MWVFEEMVEGKKLTEIINETHVNVKYLPKHPLPANIVRLKFIYSFYLENSGASPEITDIFAYFFRLQFQTFLMLPEMPIS